jgi:hypothetical protein
MADKEDPHELNYACGICDPSGFYFPLCSLTVLRVNRQMRYEALPFAYRRTVFHLDDTEDLVKLLIAVGNISRSNSESLEPAWQSMINYECQWAGAPIPNEHSLTLPGLRVTMCVQLLKQCTSLRSLRLYFEDYLIRACTHTLIRLILAFVSFAIFEGWKGWRSAI